MKTVSIVAGTLYIVCVGRALFVDDVTTLRVVAWLAIAEAAACIVLKALDKK